MATIEYFYAGHSAYAYLGSAKLMEIVTASGATLVHKPNDLRLVVPASGSIPTTERTDNHRAYFFGREIDRWAEQRNAPVVQGMPTHHHKDIELPNCFLIAAGETGPAIDALAHAFLEQHWRYDADLSDSATLVRITNELGLDGDALLAKARSDEAKTQYEKNTDEAIARSVFGSPTYFVDGDMFYGQDRLEFVERALKQPYKRS